MPRIGATWWEDDWDWRWADMVGRMKTYEEKESLMLGWPTDGGVWALKVHDDAKLNPPHLGRIWNALNAMQNP